MSTAQFLAEIVTLFKGDEPVAEAEEAPTLAVALTMKKCGCSHRESAGRGRSHMQLAPIT